MINSAYVDFNGTNSTITTKTGVLSDDDAKTVTKDVDLEFVIKDKEGTSLIKKVTLSNEAPKITKATRVSSSLTTNQGGQISNNDVTVLVKATNQYNEYVTTTAKEPRIKFSNIPDKFTVNNNNTTDASLTVGDTVSAGVYNVTVTLTYPSGVTYTDTLAIGVVAKVPVSKTALAISDPVTISTNVVAIGDSNTSYKVLDFNGDAGEITIAFNDATVTGDELIVSAAEGVNTSKITYSNSKITIATDATAGTYTLTFSPKNTDEYEGTVVVTIEIQ